MTNPNSFMQDNHNNLDIMTEKLRKTRPKPKVTIAIGLISKAKRRIILACDSETTNGAVKSHDARKIGIVEFANGKILVAQAGSAMFGDEAIEIMCRRAKSIEIENPETVRKLAEDSLRELRNKAVEFNKDCPGMDWHRYFWEDNPLDLLVAFYFDGNPYLYALNLYAPFIASRVQNSFKAIGAGKDLGSFLLKEYCDLDPDFIFADLVALSVIEKVIPNVAGCGYPTQAGLVIPIGQPEFQHPFVCDAAHYSAENITKAVNSIREQEQKMKPEKREQMLKTIREMWAGYNTLGVVENLRSRIAAYEKQ